MASNSGGSSTKQLKQVLGFWDLMSTSIGQIIGTGIMTLMGAAIALTGRSVPIAFLISALLTIGLILPRIIICGTVRVRGGDYTMVAMLAGKRMAGVVTAINVFANLALSIHALSFASYFISLFGFGNEKIIALIVTTVFFVINIFGVDIMAKFQNFIIILLCIALALFVVFGAGKVQPGYIDSHFFLNGIGGLLQAGGLLTFAVGGAQVIANLSGEAKNPTRDIPLAMISSTLIVAVLYGFISIVAAGVLPVEDVIGENLSTVAEYVLSRPLYIFFMVFGALFAIISTINAIFATATKPVLQGCDDGWLPKSWGYLHPKFKTPVVLLTLLYAIAVICIISGLSISVLSNLCLILTSAVATIIAATMWKLPKVAPDSWSHSKFKISRACMAVCVVFSVACSVFNIYLNLTQLSMPLILGNGVMLVIAIVFSQIRMKKANVEPSFEDANKTN